MTTAVTLSPLAIQQFFNNLGQPNVGGTLLTQVGGVNAATYQDAAGTIPLPNPIPLNTRGEISNATGLSCELFLQTGQSYTFTLFDAFGNQLNQATSVSNVADTTAIYAAFAASGGAALIGFIGSGTGAVARTVQSKLLDTISVVDYGGVMNNSAAGVRTSNSAALLGALAVARCVYIPPGQFWIASGTALSGFWNIVGAGAQSTFIMGDGDLFTLAAPDNGEMRRFEHLSILNNVTPGKLFSNTGTTNRVEFSHVDFSTANYHVYSSGGDAVSWKFGDCRFINAAIESRHFEGLWVYHEEACYTWYNTIGLRCTNGAVSSCSISGSTFEQNNDSAIVLDASNVSFEVTAMTINAHFEVNGKLTNNADVAVTTNAVTRARTVHMIGCGLFTPTVTQSVRVSVVANGGGNIDNVVIDTCSCMGVVPLCTNSTAIKVLNTYYQSVSPQPLNIVQPTIQYQNSLAFFGSVRVVGTPGGSSAVQALVTPPSGSRSVDIIVEGDSYNGVPNSNIALLEARYSASNGNVRATTDVNHSAGANQGFTASWTGTQIQVTNKAALTNAQSGDTLLRFWG